jgi:hypothetical protein
MPPPTEAEPVRVGPGSLHELLAVDRRGAGEVRRAQSRRELATATYSMPLTVQWRRAFRRHRKLRVMTWSFCLSVVAGVMIWQAALHAAFLTAQLGAAVEWTKGATDWAKSAADWTKGTPDWAKGATQWAKGATDWAKSATGMADGLWLHDLAEDELRATEQGP